MLCAYLLALRCLPFQRIEAIVRQIAAVLPGGVRDVEKVIISPARTGKADKIPPQWIVKLHDGG